MLRKQIAKSFLRHDTSSFISAIFHNLHTSQILAGKSKTKKNKSCEAIPVAVVSIILRAISKFSKYKIFYIVD